MGADPIPSHVRPADQPGSPRPQLSQGRLLPRVPQSVSIPPRSAADESGIRIQDQNPGSEISKTKFNTIEQNNHSYYQFQRPLTSPRPPLSARLWQRDAFPGSPGCNGRDPQREEGESPLSEFPRPGPELLIEHRRA